MKKRLLALVLTGAMILSLTACGSKGNDAAESSAPQSSETEEAAPEDGGAETEEAAPVEEEPVEEEAGMTLDEWMESSDASIVEDQLNSALASSGLKAKLAADGNTFVYEYILPDEYADVDAADLEASFEPVVEQQSSQLSELFEMFESEYGITLDSVRFDFMIADGTVLYSGEVANK